MWILISFIFVHHQYWFSKCISYICNIMIILYFILQRPLIIIEEPNVLECHQTFHQFHDLDTELDLHRLWVVCNGCGMRAGNADPSGHLVPSPIVGLACPIVETRFLELAMSLLNFSPRIPLGTFSILLKANMNRYKLYKTIAILFSAGLKSQTGYDLGVYHGWFHLHGLESIGTRVERELQNE